MSDIRIYELCADSDLVTEFVKYDDHAAIVAQLETDKENAEYCFRELKKINEQLEADLAEARKDQARYKWIVRDFESADLKIDDYLYTDFESLDDFIDEAIKEQGK